jgi:hypothetical protein
MIDYDTIDEQCVGLVKFFNDNGFTTEFSCEGHSGNERTQFFILFHSNISDKKINQFIYKFPNTMGEFMKWTRFVKSKLQSNWMYLITNNTPKINHEWAKQDLNKFSNKQGNN